MNTETMTIHKALSEIKILGDRIEKEVNSTIFCTPNKHSNTRINGVSTNEYKEQSKDALKSIKTMMNRRDAIKRAVTLSNATTSVNICGKDYKVAEAIWMKEYGIMDNMHLLEQISNQYKNAVNLVERNNKEIDNKADAYVVSLFGSKDNVKSDEAKSARDVYIAANSFDLVDCVNCQKVMKELQDKIDTFKSEVDSALSVSNAVTTITIEYETV